MSARSVRVLVVTGIALAASAGCTVETSEASTDTTPYKAEAFAPYAPVPGDVATSEAKCDEKSAKVSVETKVTSAGRKVKVFHASIDEECVDDSAGAATEAASTEKTSTPPLPDSTVTIAAYVLASVPYRDCGAGGTGSVDVTFAPTGTVEKVDVHGSWSAEVKTCIAQRFGAASIPAIKGSRTMTWPIKLPDSSGWGP